MTRYMLSFLAGALFSGAISLIPTDCVASESANEMFSHVIGVQQPVALEESTANPQMHGEHSLVWASRHIVEDLGSDILKIALDERHLKRQGYEPGAKMSLTELARHDTYQQILDLPYRVIFFWAHGNVTFQYYSGKKRRQVYDEFYEFTKHLLTEYNNTGKTFMIGNWEGDWLLGAKKVGKKTGDCTPENIERMIEWMNARGKAIADAKRDVDHHNVDVFFYMEINHVGRARTKGLKRMVNSVLPKTKYTDYVSVSAYEIMGLGQWKDPQNAESLRGQLFENLDYVESRLPPRPVSGKRVGIGEIGFPIAYVMNRYKVGEREAELIQARLALENAMVNLEWGVAFWQWWELFNNEPNPMPGSDLDYKGFGLIDQPSGRKRRLWHEVKSFNEAAENYIAAVTRRTGREPSAQKLRQAAVKWLAKRVDDLRSEEQDMINQER